MSDDDDFDNDFNDFDDDFEGEEENRFGDDFAAHERTGFRNDAEFYTEGGPEKKQKTPFDRLIETVSAICSDLISKREMGEGDKEEIISNIVNGNIDKPTYKNPTALVLGYMALGPYRLPFIKDDNDFKFDKLTDVYDLLESVEDKNVTPYDIIRYARLWDKIIPRR